ncbi:MAG: AI-2E family transporter [Ekhidna sp.]
MSDSHKNDNSFNPSKLMYILVSMVALVAILKYAEEYLITFIFALIVWFIIHELRENLQMIPFVKKHAPIWLQSMIAFFVINGVIFFVFELLVVSIDDLMLSLDVYEKNFEQVLNDVSTKLDLDLVTSLYAYTEGFDLSNFAQSNFDIVFVVLGDALLIPIYVLFLLIEESIFHYKVEALYPSKKKQKRTTKLFHKMDKNISGYFLLKTYVSLLTGVFSFFIFLLFGLDGAMLWAILIFVLNYIPTIGSLIATLFPALFAIMQFGELMPFVYILVTVGIIQLIVGNVLEPKIMGKSLNISPLVVVLSLTIWGAIWGIIGAILSVPITVMIIIVFEEIPSLRPIAIMLTEKGELNYLEDDDEDPPIE